LTANHAGAQIDIDIMVTHPWHTTAMRQARAAKQDGTAARNAEQFKLNKYKHTTITPFVLETHGRLGDHARQYLRQLLAAQHHTLSASQIHNQTLTSISSSLQRHNAVAIRAAISTQQPRQHTG
jgi:hypothetical protein